MRRISSARRAITADDGFGLLEAVVALAIATVMFTAMAGLLLSSGKASLLARSNQGGADVLNQELESVRELSYSAVTLTSGDATIAADTGGKLVSAGAGAYTYKPGLNPDVAEPVLISSTGSVVYKGTVTVNNVVYTVRRIITCPAGSTCADVTSKIAQKRLSIDVDWTDRGVAHARHTHTLITETRRGLPLPYFKLGTDVDKTAGVGDVVSFPVTLRNLGARDAWDLTWASSSTWVLYADVNKNGVYDSGTDTPHTADTNVNGLTDTGTIENNTTNYYVLVHTATVSDLATVSLVVTAKSIAQPGAASAQQSFTDNLIVTPAVTTCSTCLYLHNGATNTADTNIQTAPLPMDLNPPLATTLWKYSKDALGAAAMPGRVIGTGGTGSADNVFNTRVAVWSRQCLNASTIKAGLGSVRLYVRTLDGAPIASGSITVYVGSEETGNGVIKNSGNPKNRWTQSGSTVQPLGAWGSAAYQVVDIPVTLSSLSIVKNGYLEIRVNISSPQSLVLAYDTVTYKSYADIPLTTAGTC